MDSNVAKAGKDHCKFCFQTLLWHFAPQKHPKPILLTDNSSTAHFITWNSVQTGELRGCLGTLKAQTLPLTQSLSQYAIHSATKDYRFTPIIIDELPKLQVTVSFLHSFEVCLEWNDWIVGVHGIEIEIHDGNHLKRATFLPSVPQEQQWNHRQTLEQLMCKAGLQRGDSDDFFELVKMLKVVKYQCSKCTSKYSELGLDF